MQTTAPYHIHSGHTITESGRTAISSRVMVLRDKARQPKSQLANLFEDSHTLFRMRVHKLGSLSSPTTADEATGLRVMLEALIATKDMLQKR